MKRKTKLLILLADLVVILGLANDAVAANETRVLSPDGSVQFTIDMREGRLKCAVTYKDQSVLETSPLQFTVDAVDLAEGVEIGKTDTYRVNETYPWRGVHSQATNHCRGVTLAVKHGKSNTNYTLEARVFNDGVAFRYILPGNEKPRVPDEGATFVLPAGSTVWYHDLQGHYEGVHVKKDVADIKAGEWVAPPMTFKLAGGAAYASITEAALVNYSGMALQADGQRG